MGRNFTSPKKHVGSMLDKTRHGRSHGNLVSACEHHWQDRLWLQCVWIPCGSFGNFRTKLHQERLYGQQDISVEKN